MYYPATFKQVTKRFSHQISITARTGVGSTTCLEGLKLKDELKELPYRYIPIGKLMRARGAQNKFKEIKDFAKHKKEHPEEGHDQWCDDTVTIFASHNYVIAEGRLPHIFMPHAFKVLLACPVKVCAERRHKDEVKQNPELSLQSVERDIRVRDDHDDANFQTLYPGCLWQRPSFDYVIDTEHTPPEKVVEKLCHAHARWLKTIRRSDLIEEMYLPPSLVSVVAA